MTEAELKLFIITNEPETDYNGHYANIWIHGRDLIEWSKLIQDLTDDGGYNCVLVEDGSIYFDLTIICEFYKIDVSNVLPID